MVVDPLLAGSNIWAEKLDHHHALTQCTVATHICAFVHLCGFVQSLGREAGPLPCINTMHCIVHLCVCAISLGIFVLQYFFSPKIENISALIIIFEKAFGKLLINTVWFQSQGSPLLVAITFGICRLQYNQDMSCVTSSPPSVFVLLSKSVFCILQMQLANWSVHGVSGAWKSADGDF